MPMNVLHVVTTPLNECVAPTNAKISSKLLDLKPTTAWILKLYEHFDHLSRKGDMTKQGFNFAGAIEDVKDAWASFRNKEKIILDFKKHVSKFYLYMFDFFCYSHLNLFSTVCILFL